MGESAVEQAFRVLRRHGIFAEIKIDPTKYTIEEIEKCANNLAQTEELFAKMFRSFYNKTATLLEEEEFWSLITKLRDQIIVRVLPESLRPHYGNNQLYRSYVDGIALFFDDKELDLWQLVSFAKTYESKVEIFRHNYRTRGVNEFSHIINTNSDDRYSDIINCLPLTGENIYERCRLHLFGTQDHLEAAIEAEIRQNIDHFKTLNLRRPLCDAALISLPNCFRQFVMKGAMVLYHMRFCLYNSFLKRSYRNLRNAPVYRRWLPGD